MCSAPACSSLQLLGLQSLGFSHGFERLHYLLEAAWDGDELSHKFKKVSGRCGAGCGVAGPTSVCEL